MHSSIFGDLRVLPDGSYAANAVIESDYYERQIPHITVIRASYKFMYRRPGGDQEDTHPSEGKGRLSSNESVAGRVGVTVCLRATHRQASGLVRLTFKTTDYST